MRLNFKQSFDKTELCNVGGDRVPAAQRRVRPSSTAVSELRQADLLIARTIPGWGGLPNSCVFKCGECEVWVTESADERRDL
jgi:hypothetical protein